MTIQEVEEKGRESAKAFMTHQGKAKSGSNFPPALYALGPDGKVDVFVGFPESHRYQAIELAQRRCPELVGWVLIYDGLISEMEAGECAECEGKGCKECVGSGKQRRGEKRDAIVAVRGVKGNPGVTVSTTFYVVVGGKVLTEKPMTPRDYVPVGEEYTEKHEYGRVWKG